jgi:hypothetical protein
MEVGSLMPKNNDPFGFQKAINFKALDDPKVLNEVAKMFEKTEEPNISYKKSVNFLKSKTKKR